MYKETKRAAAILGGLVLVAGGIAVANTAFTNPASAASCYEGAGYFSKAGDTKMFPRSSGSKITTTSRCKDINLEITGATGRSVRVCFYPKAGGVTCQKNYTYSTKNKWTTIAANVKDGTKYRLQFLIEKETKGYYAS